jgi:hypothetical protein
MSGCGGATTVASVTATAGAALESLGSRRSCGDGEYIPSERVAAATCQFDARGVADGETLPQFPSESAIGEVPLFFFYPILLFECQ